MQIGTRGWYAVVCLMKSQSCEWMKAAADESEFGAVCVRCRSHLVKENSLKSQDRCVQEEEEEVEGYAMFLNHCALCK